MAGDDPPARPTLHEFLPDRFELRERTGRGPKLEIMIPPVAYERGLELVKDEEGVGELVRIAVERGRRERPDLELGVCGEHGGDPQSIRFFHDS